MPVSEPAALPAEAPEHRLRFSTIDQFVGWLNQTGHPSKKRSTKFFEAVGAVDGNGLVTDGGDWECYVFSSRASWADLERRAQEIADRLSVPLEATSYRTYNNVRCLF